MHALAPIAPAHALPRVRSSAQERLRAPGRSWPSATGCKTASKKKSSFSRSRTHARCAPAQTVPKESALFPVASISGALVLRFPGQYADSETGLFYNYYRTYQPNQGRYTQNDPIGLAGGWNRYGYVEGNPLSKIDPAGLQSSVTAGSLGRGALAGGLRGSSAGAVGIALGIGVGMAAEMCKPTDRDREERQCDADYDAGLKFCHAMAVTTGRHKGTPQYAETYSRCMRGVEEAYVECYQKAGK
jgi:RHS repeat-associated protein